jgi:hypothetical protein
MADTPLTRATGPVFVAGCPRSGTTALSWAIASHPGYFTSAETHFFYYMLRETEDNSLQRVFDISSGDGSWLKKYNIGFDEFLAYLGSGFDKMMRERLGGMQWVDGSPENVIVCDRLLAMFPTAHMFVLMRDPRAVCVSMLNSGFAPPWAGDLDAAINEWCYYARIAGAVAMAFPERVLIIKQEDMRQSAASVATVIGERLRLSRPETIAAFLNTTTVNSSFDRKTYAVDSPLRTPHASAFPREGFMEKHGSYIMRATADLAEQFGYFDEGKRP